jgi:hypothetical protein
MRNKENYKRWADAGITQVGFAEALNTKRLAPYRKLFPQFDYSIIEGDKSLIPDDRSFAEKYKL